MTIAQFTKRHTMPPRQLIAVEADAAFTTFSAILQNDLLTLRLSRLGITIPITFNADDFVQQMAWLLDVQEDAV